VTSARDVRPREPGLLGLGLVVLSAFCYSMLSIFGKIALSLGLPILPLLATRFVLGGMILWAWVLLSREGRRAIAGVPGSRVRGLLAWGVFGFSGQSALFFMALQRIPASLTEVLLYTCPAFLALMLWGMTGRRPGGSRLMAIALALLGTWLCAGPIDGVVDPLGALLATLSGFWYAAFLIWMHRLTPGIPGIVSSAYIITGAAIAFSVATFVQGGGYLVPRGATAWGSLLGIVLSSTVFGLVLFVAGLKRVGPQTASVLSTFEPVGTLLLAAIVLHERLRGAQWAGAALIIGAAFVLASTAEEEGRVGSLDAPLPAIPGRTGE